MFVFVRTRTSGFENDPELYSSGKFSILAKFWISFKSYLIDPKFHGDHDYLVYFYGSSMVKSLSLTSGIVPENLHESNK
jgi:hypothetical protein